MNAELAGALIGKGHTQGRSWKCAQVSPEVLARLAESDDPKMARAAKDAIALREAEAPARLRRRLGRGCNIRAGSALLAARLGK